MSSNNNNNNPNNTRNSLPSSHHQVEGGNSWARHQSPRTAAPGNNQPVVVARPRMTTTTTTPTTSASPQTSQQRQHQHTSPQHHQHHHSPPLPTSSSKTTIHSLSSEVMRFQQLRDRQNQQQAAAAAASASKSRHQHPRGHSSSSPSSRPRQQRTSPGNNNNSRNNSGSRERERASGQQRATGVGAPVPGVVTSTTPIAAQRNSNNNNNSVEEPQSPTSNGNTPRLTPAALAKHHEAMKQRQHHQDQNQNDEDNDDEISPPPPHHQDSGRRSPVPANTTNNNLENDKMMTDVFGKQQRNISPSRHQQQDVGTRAKKFVGQVNDVVKQLTDLQKSIEDGVNVVATKLAPAPPVLLPQPSFSLVTGGAGTSLSGATGGGDDQTTQRSSSLPSSAGGYHAASPSPAGQQSSNSLLRRSPSRHGSMVIKYTPNPKLISDSTQSIETQLDNSVLLLAESTQHLLQQFEETAKSATEIRSQQVQLTIAQIRKLRQSVNKGIEMTDRAYSSPQSPRRAAIHDQLQKDKEQQERKRRMSMSMNNNNNNLKNENEESINDEDKEEDNNNNNNNKPVAQKLDELLDEEVFQLSHGIRHLIADVRWISEFVAEQHNENRPRELDDLEKALATSKAQIDQEQNRQNILEERLRAMGLNLDEWAEAQSELQHAAENTQSGLHKKSESKKQSQLDQVRAIIQDRAALAKELDETKSKYENLLNENCQKDEASNRKFVEIENISMYKDLELRFHKTSHALESVSTETQIGDKLISLQTQKIKQDDEIQSLKQQLADLQSESDIKLAQKEQQLQQSIKSYQDQIEQDVNKLRTEKNAELSEKDTSISDLKLRLKLSEEALASSKRQRATAEEDLNKIIDSVRDDVASSQKELREVKAEKAKHEAAAKLQEQEWQQSLKRANEELEKAVKTIAEKNKKNKQLEAELKESEEKRSESEQDIDKVKKELLDEGKKSNQEAQQQIENLKSDKKQLEEVNSQYQEKIQQLMGGNTDAYKKTTALEDKLTDTKEDNDKKTKQIAQLESKIETLQKNASDSSLKLQEKDITIKQQQQQIENLEKNIEENQQQNEARLAEEVSNLQENMKGLQEREAGNTRLIETVKSLEENIQRIQEEDQQKLEEKDAQIEQLMNLRSVSQFDSEAEKQQLNEELTKERAASESLKQQLEEASIKHHQEVNTLRELFLCETFEHRERDKYAGILKDESTAFSDIVAACNREAALISKNESTSRSISEAERDNRERQLQVELHEAQQKHRELFEESQNTKNLLDQSSFLQQESAARSEVLSEEAEAFTSGILQQAHREQLVIQQHQSQDEARKQLSEERQKHHEEKSRALLDNSSADAEEKEKIQTLLDEINQLKSDKSDLEEQLQKEDKELDEAKRKCDETIRELNNIKKVCEDASQQLEVTKNKCAELQELHKQEEARNQQLVEENERKQKKIDENDQQQTQTADEQLKKLKSDLYDAEKSLEDQKKDYEKLQQQLTDTEKKLEDTEKKLEVTEKKLEDASAELEKQAEQHETAIQNLLDKQQQKEDNDKKLVEEQIQLLEEEKEAELLAAQKKHSEEKKQLREQLEQEASDAFNAKTDEKSAQAKKLQQELDGEKQKSDDQLEKISELEAEIDGIKEQLADSEKEHADEVESFKQQLQDAQDSLLKQQMSSHDRETELNATISSLRDDLLAAQTSTTVSAENTPPGKTRDGAAGDNEDEEHNGEEKMERVETKSAKMKRLFEERIQELKNQMESQEDSYKDLLRKQQDKSDSDKKSVEKELEHRTDEVEDQKKKNQKMKQENQERIGELEAQLEAAKEDAEDAQKNAKELADLLTQTREVLKTSEGKLNEQNIQLQQDNESLKNKIEKLKDEMNQQKDLSERRERSLVMMNEETAAADDNKSGSSRKQSPIKAQSNSNSNNGVQMFDKFQVDAIKKKLNDNFDQERAALREMFLTETVVRQELENRLHIQQSIFSEMNEDQNECLKNRLLSAANSSDGVDVLLLLMRNIELAELEARNVIIHESLSPEKFKSLLQLQTRLEESEKERQAATRATEAMREEFLNENHRQRESDQRRILNQEERFEFTELLRNNAKGLQTIHAQRIVSLNQAHENQLEKMQQAIDENANNNKNDEKIAELRKELAELQRELDEIRKEAVLTQQQVESTKKDLVQSNEALSQQKQQVQSLTNDLNEQTKKENTFKLLSTEAFTREKVKLEQQAACIDLLSQQYKEESRITSGDLEKKNQLLAAQLEETAQELKQRQLEHQATEADKRRLISLFTIETLASAEAAARRTIQDGELDARQESIAHSEKLQIDEIKTKTDRKNIDALRSSFVSETLFHAETERRLRLAVEEAEQISDLFSQVSNSQSSSLQKTADFALSRSKRDTTSFREMFLVENFISRETKQRALVQTDQQADLVEIVSSFISQRPVENNNNKERKLPSIAKQNKRDDQTLLRELFLSGGLQKNEQRSRLAIFTEELSSRPPYLHITPEKKGLTDEEKKQQKLLENNLALETLQREEQQDCVEILMSELESRPVFAPPVDENRSALKRRLSELESINVALEHELEEAESNKKMRIAKIEQLESEREPLQQEKVALREMFVVENFQHTEQRKRLGIFTEELESRPASLVLVNSSSSNQHEKTDEEVEAEKKLRAVAANDREEKNLYSQLFAIESLRHGQQTGRVAILMAELESRPSPYCELNQLLSSTISNNNNKEKEMQELIEEHKSDALDFRRMFIAENFVSREGAARHGLLAQEQKNRVQILSEMMASSAKPVASTNNTPKEEEEKSRSVLTKADETAIANGALTRQFYLEENLMRRQAELRNKIILGESIEIAEKLSSVHHQMEVSLMNSISTSREAPDNNNSNTESNDEMLLAKKKLEEEKDQLNAKIQSLTKERRTFSEVFLGENMTKREVESRLSSIVNPESSERIDLLLQNFNLMMSSLQAENNKLRQELEGKEKEHLLAMQRMASADDDDTVVPKKKHDALQKTLDLAQEQIAALKRKIAELESVNIALEHELEEAESNKKMRIAKIEKLESELETIKDQDKNARAAADEEHQKLQQELDNVKQQLSNLQQRHQLEKTSLSESFLEENFFKRESEKRQKILFEAFDTLIINSISDCKHDQARIFNNTLSDSNFVSSEGKRDLAEVMNSLDLTLLCNEEADVRHNLLIAAFSSTFNLLANFNEDVKMINEAESEMAAQAQMVIEKFQREEALDRLSLENDASLHQVKLAAEFVTAANLEVVAPHAVDWIMEPTSSEDDDEDEDVIIGGQQQQQQHVDPTLTPQPNTNNTNDNNSMFSPASGGASSGRRHQYHHHSPSSSRTPMTLQALLFRETVMRRDLERRLQDAEQQQQQQQSSNNTNGNTTSSYGNDTSMMVGTTPQTNNSNAILSQLAVDWVEQ